MLSTCHFSTDQQSQLRFFSTHLTNEKLVIERYFSKKWIFHWATLKYNGLISAPAVVVVWQHGVQIKVKNSFENSRQRQSHYIPHWARPCRWKNCNKNAKKRPFAIVGNRDLEVHVLFSRRDAKHIFDCFLEVAKPFGDDQEPFILQSYPSQYKDREADKIKLVPHFTFPCTLDM